MFSSFSEKVASIMLAMSLWWEPWVPLFDRIQHRLDAGLLWPLRNPVKFLGGLILLYRYQETLGDLVLRVSGFCFGLGLRAITEECDGALFYVTPDRISVRRYCIGVKTGMEARKALLDAIISIRDSLVLLLVLWLVVSLAREKLHVRELKQTCTGKEASLARIQAGQGASAQELRTVKKDYERLKVASAKNERTFEDRLAHLREQYALATDRRIKATREMERRLAAEVHDWQNRALSVQTKFENAAARESERVAEQHGRELAVARKALEDFKRCVGETELGARCSRLETELSRTKEDAAAAAAEAAAHAEQEKKNLEAEVRALRGDLNEMSTKKSLCEEENAKLLGHKQELLASLETAHKQLEIFGSQLVAADLARVKEEEAKTLLVGTGQTLETELQNALLERDASQSTAANLEGQLVTAREDVCRMEAALTDAQTELVKLRAQIGNGEHGVKPESEPVNDSKGDSEPSGKLRHVLMPKSRKPAVEAPAAPADPTPAPAESAVTATSARGPEGTDEAWKQDPNLTFQRMYHLGRELHESCVAWSKSSGPVGSIIGLYDLKARLEAFALVWDELRKNLGPETLADVVQKSYLHTVMLSVSLTSSWEKSDKSGVVEAARQLVEKCAEIGLAMNPAHKGYL
ncbi:hypothetical protein L228DRAFT_278352 [Xylona heveae TC161]|uniref:Uncharacterized protein n=1 Tax=Xylona heveae (strain CBS 132557 / TC161) TaxID=1328760 RepID=A0A165FMF8_XYLHT|nr:hypothetical protein L228DRAFT_278352 [Xylona heveae TC161]KZF21155.1 hypothetical protein L228DRAFT_278352 [Xylona heveae TC161]